MEIIIWVNHVPIISNIDLFIAGNVCTLFGEELILVWNSADFRIVNLETSLADSNTTIFKCEHNLIGQLLL